MTIVIQKATSAALTFYPPRQWMAAPTAADIRVRTPTVALPAEGSETSITANIDGVSTTLSAAASRDDTSVTVASATGITVGRRYLITSNGKKIVVKVAAVVSTTIHLDEPLRDALANASTFVGIAVTHTISSSDLATTGEGEIILRLTLGGVVRRVDEILRVEDRVFPLTLTSDGLVRGRPEVLRLRNGVDLDLDDVITEAWEGVLRPRLRARKITEDRIRTPSEIETAHKEACILLLMRSAGRSEEDLERQDLRLFREINNLMESRDFWYEVQSTTSSARGDTTLANTTWISR